MAEKEYIEREEIIKRIKLRIDDYSRDYNSFASKMVLAYKEFLYMVEHLPTADVQEVRHGKWILLNECANEGIYCSACHKKVYQTDYANQKLKSNYCPNCGAKMDKE